MTSLMPGRGGSSFRRTERRKNEVRFTKYDLRIIMKTINMGEKVELTALQLVYLLDDAMETLCLRAEDGQEVDTMVIAKEKVLELFERRKEGNNG